MEVVSRYGDDPDDVALNVGRIMLRFRAIAPKPISGVAVSIGGSVDPRSAVGKRKRAEGKRVRRSLRKSFADAEAGAFWEEGSNARRVCDGDRLKAGACQEEKVDPDPPALVTLPLMPETPSPAGSEGHVWISKGPASRRRRQHVGSRVTVECVTGAWQSPPFCVPPPPDALEADACPCFVSDAAGEGVTWTNAAYRRMVVGSEEFEAGAVSVVLGAAMGVVLPGEGAAGFTCSARYTCASRGREVSMVAPCDVWRLGDGGLAWRLDVKAALGLSLGW